MSAALHDLAKKRGYHHGNLREALIEASLRLIGEKGPAGFTMAEAARAAGVSPAAPYRHFRDRDDIMAEIARRGFESLTTRLRAAWDEGRPRVEEAFTRVGRAYIAFAREEPATYASMYQSGLSYVGYPALQEASDRSFALHCEQCEAVMATLPGKNKPPPLVVALHIWAQSHGIASLFAHGNSTRLPDGLSAEEMLLSSVGFYLVGLVNDLQR